MKFIRILMLLYTRLCDKVCQWLATGQCFFLLVLWFPPPIKLTINTIKQTNISSYLLNLEQHDPYDHGHDGSSIMIWPLHVNKGKLNKCISKASVDTVFCLTQYIAGHNNVLDTVICWTQVRSTLNFKC
jgi:hypothetical protein